MAAGGLEEATDAIRTFQVWLYGFLAVGSIAYLIYNVILAMLDMKQWGQVLVDVGKVALAGGVVVLANWAWSIWGA